MSVKQIEGYSIFMSKVLGKGSYGSVYQAKEDKTGLEVAAKILSKDSSTSTFIIVDRDDYLKASLTNEIQILQKLHSDNIVGFYDVMESSKNYYIIQELCDGDLAADIKPQLQHPELEAIEMLKQICNGFLALVK
jgi:serine/threonine protein kinase